MVEQAFRVQGPVGDSNHGVCRLANQNTNFLGEDHPAKPYKDPDIEPALGHLTGRIAGKTCPDLLPELAKSVCGRLVNKYLESYLAAKVAFYAIFSPRFGLNAGRPVGP